MIILDENFNITQYSLLKKWYKSIKQIGYDISYKGIKDDLIITMLHKLKNPTFITFDKHFYNKNLCHKNYCILYIDFDIEEIPFYIRDLLKHPLFNSSKKRLGKIVKLNINSINYFEIYSENEILIKL